MTTEQSGWIQRQIQFLNEKVTAYPEKVRPLVEAPFVLNALTKVTTVPKVQADFSAYQLRVESLLTLLPSVESVNATVLSQYTKELRNFKNHLQKTYNFVQKGYYTRIWLPLGVALGSSYGVLLKNIALGIPLGIAIGVAIGAGLDKKAERENRVL